MTGCSYGNHCLGLNVTLEDCAKCHNAKLHHLCQGEYEQKFFPQLDLGLSKLCLSCLQEKVNQSTASPPKDNTSQVRNQTPKTRQQQIENTPDGESSGKSRVAPSTTARNTKKKQSTSKRCQKGARVKVKRKDFFHVLIHDEQRSSLKGFGNNRNFHGTVVSGNGRQGYNIRFDEMPVGKKDVTISRRNVITVLNDGEEEKEYDYGKDDEYTKIIKNNNEKEQTKTAEDLFCEMSDDDISKATSYVYEDPKNPDITVRWTIVKDGEAIEWETVPEASVEWAKDAKMPAETKGLSDLFFSHFLPSIDGHALLIDEYHSDRRSTYYSTVRDDRIQFHDEEADDPDWIVKQCYLLMIAAATEVDVGVENLWLRGKSNGRRNYPNFGRYIQQNTFKAFQHAAPYCFCDKQYWYIDRQDRPWEIFLPCLNSFNDRRKHLIKLNLLMLDESMSGWRPKTSKLGGLPNYTYEARKPVPLGTMFRNSVECVSGCLVFQDIVQLPEVQSRKKYFGELSSLPGMEEIKATTSEVLRQVEGSGVKKGGWVGGDAWFGSIMSSVEVYKRFGVHSTFVVKNNTRYFPMRVLHRILVARYKRRPAGHWVVMHTTIADVPIMVVAYAWSQRGVTYLVSTCGSTTVHPTKYQSKFEDDFGNIRIKDVNRPWVAHFLYEYLPLVDEHNKQRQSILNLERCWLTKDCWFRLLTTIVGMSVVDMHRWYRNKKGTKKQEDNELQIRKFSDMLCNKLEDNVRNQHQPRRRLAGGTNWDNTEKPRLIRIKDKDGFSARPATDVQRGDGRNVGSAIVKNCYVCRKYLDKNDRTVYKQTSFCCSVCLMPLCQEDRSDPKAKRHDTCYQEHVGGLDPEVACNGSYHLGKRFPADKQIEHHLKRKRKAPSREASRSGGQGNRSRR